MTIQVKIYHRQEDYWNLEGDNLSVKNELLPKLIEVDANTNNDDIKRLLNTFESSILSITSI